MGAGPPWKRNTFGAPGDLRMGAEPLGNRCTFGASGELRMGVQPPRTNSTFGASGELPEPDHKKPLRPRETLAGFLVVVFISQTRPINFQAAASAADPF